jgi:hypothetical protein
MGFKELDTVVLTRDVPEVGLKAGDLGAVVFVTPPDALEVNQSTVYSRLGSARRALATFLQSRYPDEFGGSHG